MTYAILAIIVAFALFVVGYMNLPKFGRPISGERKKRVEQSVNYRNGAFHNREFTPQLTSDKSRVRVMFDFLFEKREQVRPPKAIDAIKSDLKSLDRDVDLFVWFGHSSYYIQSGGERMLVDPVFEDAAPLSFFNKPFDGTDIYHADDMPDIDYLIITHDHWDHLDYKTVTALLPRVGRVICPLGVGEHFEYWGYPLSKIVELDWDEKYETDSGFTIYALTARHFSGRTLRSNQTLWASYMIVSKTQTIYISGDGGYGNHFKKIASAFPSIDLAIMENGQYNKDWRHIHIMPEELKISVEELNPKMVMAGHNSKYALAKHPWDEPLRTASSIKGAVIPKIGEVVISYR